MSAWFRVESTGYAAHPIDARGWAAVAVFVIVQIALAIAMLPGSFGLWMILFLVLTALFVWFCMSKTEGTWAWQRRSGE